jgi:mannobiose 2-epimerase
MQRSLLTQYREELQEELHSILQWWISHMVNASSEFNGEVDAHDQLVLQAPRGLVMYSRILWTFSEAYQLQDRKEYLEMAERAYVGLMQQFNDATHKGFFWSIGPTGAPLETQKQLYGQAFALYGLTAYAAATYRPEALEKAKEIFFLLEEKGKDPIHQGYWEARAHDWSDLADMRLSEKDPNVAKSMNTHLHILEAYTRLAKEWPNEVLLQAIDHLLSLFKQHIIRLSSSRQQLYFNTDWTPVGDFESYGHDIEASWLLYEAACLPGLEKRKAEFGEIALRMATASSVALDTDGGLFYERDLVNNHLSKEKHWWPQAEAMVGYFNAWEIGKDEIQLERSWKAWEFIKENILDHTNGEWFWGLGEDGKVLSLPKAGFWKCPYHNGRACLEIIKRIEGLPSSFNVE